MEYRLRSVSKVWDLFKLKCNFATQFKTSTIRAWTSQMTKTRFACHKQMFVWHHVHWTVHRFHLRVPVWAACQWAPQASLLLPDCQAVKTDTQVVSQVCKQQISTWCIHHSNVGSNVFVESKTKETIGHIWIHFEDKMRVAALSLFCCSLCMFSPLGSSRYSDGPSRYYKWPSRDTTSWSSHLRLVLRSHNFRSWNVPLCKFLRSFCCCCYVVVCFSKVFDFY